MPHNGLLAHCSICQPVTYIRLDIKSVVAGWPDWTDLDSFYYSTTQGSGNGEFG